MERIRRISMRLDELNLGYGSIGRIEPGVLCACVVTRAPCSVRVYVMVSRLLARGTSRFRLGDVIRTANTTPPFFFSSLRRVVFSLKWVLFLCCINFVMESLVLYRGHATRKCVGNRKKNNNQEVPFLPFALRPRL